MEQIKLFLITYEGSQWCGALNSHCVVAERDETRAEENMLAVNYMEETMRELFADEYRDEPGLEEDSAYILVNVEEFFPEHEDWQYFIDETQRQFFEPVNFAFEDVDLKTGLIAKDKVTYLELY